MDGRRNRVVGLGRRRLLKSAAWATGAIATGAGTWVIPASTSWAAAPIKVGIATDLSGAIGFAGNSDLNVAKFCADIINKSGGLLGRPVQIHVEDTASNEAIAVSNARKLIQRDRVDVVLGGITSSMRNAIKGPIVERGRTLYIYPQLYEGKECESFIYCTGPTPSQQCDRLVPWLIKNGGKRFAFPSANYIWPHVLNTYARNLVQQSGGEVVLEEYYPIDQMSYGATVNKIMSEKVDVVFNTVIPPGVGPFFKQLYEAGFLKRGGRLCCVYYDENDLNINAPQEIEGLASCLDYFRAVDKIDPTSAKIHAEYNAMFPHTQYLLSAGSAATGMYRGMMLWAEAVKNAGKLDRESVGAALDHAKIAIAPGGPAEMVPSKRHCKMKMYIGVAKGGDFEIVESSDGLLDPKEC
ncbi:MAG: substrate-binding protein [Pseudomonadota bacterium]|nr:substrate-binding protein [Pseudomonadota bacterium]